MYVDKEEEICHYKAIGIVNLTQLNAVCIIFDTLLWWGEQNYSISILNYVAKTKLVIAASSTESERQFSGAA